MALTVGTNSWVTVAEANTYFADRFGASTTWASLTNAQKEQLLITAFRWIQSRPEFSISASATDTYIKEAQMELAWWIYNYMDAHEQRRALYIHGVRNFQLSKWEEELDKSEFPGFISDMLADALTGLGGYFPTATRDFE